jgi:hypothetical protein
MTDPEPQPFDPATDCLHNPAPCTGDACILRCQERYLNNEPQANDWLADKENAAGWRRYYDANPGVEEASRAACDPKTYEGKP